MVSFQELYDAYAADVYRFALWLTGDTFRAEDITADTFVRAWAGNNPIRTETLKAYLFTIARNLFLGQQRKTTRHVALEDAQPAPAPGPDRLVESRQLLQQVREILLALPECDRTAFVLRVQHELPYAESARVLAISLAASKVKVHRVRRKLLLMRLDEEDL